MRTANDGKQLFLTRRGRNVSALLVAYISACILSGCVSHRASPASASGATNLQKPYSAPTTTDPDCGPDASDTWIADKDLIAQLHKSTLMTADSDYPVVVGGPGESLGSLFGVSTLPLRITNKTCWIDSGSTLVIENRDKRPPKATSQRFVFALADHDDPFNLPPIGQSIRLNASNGHVEDLAIFWVAADVDDLFNSAEQIAQIIDGSRWSRVTDDPAANLYVYVGSQKASYKDVATLKAAFCGATNKSNAAVFATWRREGEQAGEQKQLTAMKFMVQREDYIKIVLTIVGCPGVYAGPQGELEIRHISGWKTGN